MPSPYRNRSSKKPRPRTTPAKPAEPQEAPRKLDEYQREQRHPSGPVWDRKKANVISAHGGICALCEHPGATQVDHIVVDYPLDNSLGEPKAWLHGSSGKKQKTRVLCAG